MLPLRGSAKNVRGFGHKSTSTVIRLRSATDNPENEADAALLRNEADIIKALRSGFLRGVMIGDISAVASDLDAFSSLMCLPIECNYLENGDLLGWQTRTGRFRTLYRRSSSHNSFLVTERCNHNCLMCSQPPRAIDDTWLLDEIAMALPLVDPQTPSFAFTGGETLLNSDRFVQLLRQCVEVLPKTAVHVLTNGRAFANDEVIDAWTAVKHPHLTAAIPIYSAVDHIHDYVVQSFGALDETVLGILKLKDREQRVEVRIVLHALTAPRIIETCRWLARNLPFVDHVAIMGLEHTGFALANSELLSIDPIDYQEALERAVLLLAASGMHVSVYNLPRCVLARSIWRYAVQSISDWKRGYVEECSSCSEKESCTGFFTTGRLQRSRGIAAIMEKGHGDQIS